MDKALSKRLRKIEEQIAVLKQAEGLYLSLEAHRKVLFSKLFLEAPGASNAIKEANAHVHEDWVNFSKGLAEAEANLNEQRRRYELRLKAFDGEYTTYKVESMAITRSK